MAQTKIRSGQLDALSYICDGRLSLESGVPVSISDQTSASIVRFIPYKGDYIGLYNGVKWEVSTFAETELDISGISGSTICDIFGYDNSGTFTLTSGSWTNTTTRDVAITTQDGVYVRTGETDKRYLGTIYVNDNGVCQDTTSLRYVWNYYNRVVRNLFCQDTTDSWAYTTATVREANNNTTAGVGRFELVIGVAEDIVSFVNINSTRTTADADAIGGIGIDSTSVNSHQIGGCIIRTATVPLIAKYEDYIAVGYHYIQRTEYSGAAGTTTWLGDGSGDKLTGMMGRVMG